MAGRRNKPTDVFKKIDMKGGDRSVCWPYLGGHSDKGIPYFDFDGKKHVAYDFVYKLVKGAIPKGHIVRHSCDMGAPAYLRGDIAGACCNPHHLGSGTHQDNMNDMKQRERHGLPHHVVRAIRKLSSEGKSQHLIAELYGISRENVSAIVTGRNYSHVGDHAKQQGAEDVDHGDRDDPDP